MKKFILINIADFSKHPTPCNHSETIGCALLGKKLKNYLIVVNEAKVFRVDDIPNCHDVRNIEKFLDTASKSATLLP